MNHSSLTKYLLYHIVDATFSLRQINSKEDLDHLHSFRVSLRLIRSLLQLYITEPILFPEPLKAFLKATNFLRELDVLLLSLPNKTSKKVVKQLLSLRNERFTRLFTDESKIQIYQALDEFYDSIASLNTTLPNDYLIRLAYRHYEESLKNYFTLVQSASPKELHKLRIDFKISRYAFDFLHDSGLNDSYEKIEESKELQDNLGKLHDLYNQIELLTTLQKQKPSKGLKTLIMERKRLLKNSKLPLNLSNPPLS